MKQIRSLLALGMGAFLGFALATLPAHVLLSRLQKFDVRAGGVEGTVWRGRAHVLQVANANLGTLEWNLRLLPLFIGRIEAGVKLNRPDGFAQTELSISPAAVRFRDLTASLPLSALPANAFPGGWSGTADGKFTALTLKNGWPTQAQGTLDLVNLTGPAQRPTNLGSYRVVFPESDAAETLTGALSDLGGPLQISGKVQLNPDRSYLLDALIATRADAPRDVVNALQFLGAPDEQGRRPFSLSGTM